MGRPKDFYAQGTMKGSCAEAAEDCGAVNGIERVDDVDTQADPKGGPGKFACSLPIEPQLGRAERSERFKVLSERIKRFPKSRLRVSLTAIGRTPSPFFFRGMRRLAHNHAAMWSWM